MTLDSTYFQGELYLPFREVNSEAVGHSASVLQTVGEEDLSWYITKYEFEFLRVLLGEKLSNSFIKGLEEDPVDQKWIDLKDNLYKTVNGFGFSPAANYVYYWTRRRSRTQTTIVGEKVGRMDYASTTSDADVLVKVWNDMCDMVKVFVEGFLCPNWEAYKEYSGNVWCVGDDFKYINKWNI